MGIMSNEAMAMVFQATRLRLGNVECDPMDLGGSLRNVPDWAVQGGGSGERTIPLVRVPFQQASGGATTLVCTVKIEVYKSGKDSESFTLIARFWTDASTTVTLPPGLRPVRLIHDALRQTLESSLRVSPIEIGIQDPNFPEYRQFKWDFTIDVPPPPVNLSYDMKLECGTGGTWTLKRLKCARDEKLHAEMKMSAMAGYPSGTINLVLTPSASTAAFEAGFTEMLDEKIVVKDVRRLLIGLK